MARNGSGIYSLPPGSTVTNGDTSDATDVNTPLADLETDNNTARPIVAGGTGATSAAGARTNLGIAIGSDVQAYDAALASIAATGTAADKVIYTTGVDTFAEADISAFGRSIIDDADEAALRTTLGWGDVVTYAVSVNADFSVNPGRVTTRGTINTFVQENRAPTRGTSVSFTGTTDPVEYLGVIPSWATRVAVRYYSTDFGRPIIQLGVGGTYVTTGYEFTHTTIDTGASGGSNTSGFVVWADEVVSGEFEMRKADGTNEWQCVSQYRRHGAGNGWGVGSVTLGGALTDVRIQDVAGTQTFSAGVIELEYE